jgi:hypothetical protein
MYSVRIYRDGYEKGYPFTTEWFARFAFGVAKGDSTLTKIELVDDHGNVIETWQPLDNPPSQE